MEDPQEEPLAVHCFCVCSRSALLGDLLGVSKSRERDLLSVLSIYPRIFLHVFIAYCLLVGFLFVWLYTAICSCVLVVLVKLSELAKWWLERLLWWHLYVVRRLPLQSPGGRAWLSAFFLSFGLLMLLCVHRFPRRPYTIYILYAYSLLVLKVPLNSNHPIQSLLLYYPIQSLLLCVLLCSGSRANAARSSARSEAHR